MNSKSCCSPAQQRRVTEVRRFLIYLTICAASFLAGGARSEAGDAPAWMHAVVNAPLPPHDEKADVVLLYSERNVTVQSADKVKITVREAYKILRPGGREYGTVVASFNSRSKITGMRGWCIPAQGKDYEVKDKEAIEISLPKIDGSELHAAAPAGLGIQSCVAKLSGGQTIAIGKPVPVGGERGQGDQTRRQYA